MSKTWPGELQHEPVSAAARAVPKKEGLGFSDAVIPETTRVAIIWHC
jgi:hypothetical protein